MISGTIDGNFLDDPAFAPRLTRAEALDVPLFLRPYLIVRLVPWDPGNV
jgi:hypothetical protein